ncbi:hypothetical protein Jiend_43390 [Micromonospora endophytica]|nr:hypothetical protein Jiend_43390 [Micromonospora endophytica]
MGSISYEPERHRGGVFLRLRQSPLQAPVDLARHLVFGAVDYARDLGFEGPHDNPDRVMRTLDRKVGRDNYDFMVVRPTH